MRGIVVLSVLAVRLAAPDAAAAEPAAPRVLRTAAEIAAESPAADRPPARVAFEGPVSYQDPTRTIFVADETGVTFAFGGSNPIVQPGDVVRIKGIAQQGVIIGGIRPDTIEVTGRGAPPPATPVEPEDLPTGRHHYRRITIEGVIRRVMPAGDAALALVLHTAGTSVRIEVEAAASEAEAQARRLVDARVRATGIVVGNVNDRRQVVEPFIRVKRPADVEVLEPPPADPFAIPITPLDALATRALGDRRVRVGGTAVAGVVGDAVYLREGSRSICVHTPERSVRAGDIVEAVGFPEMGLYSVELSDAGLRITGSGPPPEPRPAPARLQSMPDRLDAELVQVEGPVTATGPDAAIVVRHGEIDYTIDPAVGQRLAIAVGAIVRATGICRVSAVEGRNYRAFPRAYRLLLDGPGAVEVVRPAPWWTPRRLLAAATAGVTALAAAVGLAAAWIVLLRRQVRRQLTVIEGSLRAEAVAEERRRIAREFHDSVNQGLAAAALRLDAAAGRLTDERSKSVLDRQRRLLGTLQAEAREFLWDLRDPMHADAPLAAALEAQLEFVAAPTDVAIAFDPPADGSDPGAGLTPEARHQIVRIVREAVANAVRHAAARSVVVRLRGTGPGGLVIEVADDGAGFDVAARAAADGHFGIRGMQERARRIGGDLTIESTPAAGTRVTLSLPPVPGSP
jgi:signal transduction histidine kinase